MSYVVGGRRGGWANGDGGGVSSKTSVGWFLEEKKSSSVDKTRA